MPLIIPATQTLAATGYDIDNSCRFDRASSPSLVSSAFTFADANTLSFWVKRGHLATGSTYVYQGDSMYFVILSTDLIEWAREGGDTTTTRVFRDPSAWYHFHLKATVSATQLYINGVLDSTITNSASYSSTAFTIGATTGLANFFGGYLAEFHCVNGSSLDPDSFGEAGDYGEWKPIEYTGSHGTGGFHLDFKAGGNLGNDAAGGTDLTENNLAASDQTTDTPTNNFAVMNNLDNYYYGGTFSEGNLKLVTGGNQLEGSHTGTFGMSSGKWYFEVMQTSSGTSLLVGIRGSFGTGAKNSVGIPTDGYAYIGLSGYQNLVIGGSYTAYGTVVTKGDGDIISVAVDLDNMKCYWAKNGTYLNSGDPAGNSNGRALITPPSGFYYPCIGDYDSSSYGCFINFGQEGLFGGNTSAGGNADDEGYGNFKYDVPAGFKALCSKNLTDCAVTPSEHFNTVLYTGNASVRSETGVGFQPDLVWIKSRTSTYSHRIYDAVRGVTKELQSDTVIAEATQTGGVTAFGSDGFSLGTYGPVNNTGDSFVAWDWKAGNSSGSSNGDGTITSTVTVNSDAKFSIVKWAGDSSESATVGHGLGVIPDVLICKEMNGTDWWHFRHGSLATTHNMFPNETNASRTDANVSGHIADLTSTTVFGFTSSGGGVYDNVVAVNESGKNNIAYCWAEVEGFSKFGSYEGNGNADGTFVYCGFSPAFIMTKSVDSTSAWQIFDNKREGYNADNDVLEANTTAAETTTDYIDILSNGFKSRITTDPNVAETYVFMAFAATPFKNANAR